MTMLASPVSAQSPRIHADGNTTHACLFVFEPNVRLLNYLKRTFGSSYDLHLFSDEADFLTSLTTASLETAPKPALVLLAWDGLVPSQSVLERVRTAWPETPVLVLAATAGMEDYEAFARLGAAGVVLKPFVDDSLEVGIARHLLNQHQLHQHQLSQNTCDAGLSDTAKEVPLEGGLSFVRSSRRMREVEAQAQLVARSDIPVLILGESGTGKEVLAVYTHQMSRRADQMFLKVNCAAMPADLLESELFGYEQGAFTGASKSKPGKFEICEGGTIFLDEIGEMSAPLQAKLLHVLQDGTFTRLGGRRPARANVRIIAATNINIKDAMARKTFREDLYYRLNGICLSLPPLRERLEEIPVLTRYFLRKGAARYGLDPLAPSVRLLNTLAQYHWPGNLRELENVCNRYLVLRDERAVIEELDIVAPALPVPQDLVRSGAADWLGSTHIQPGGLKHMARGAKGEAESAVIAVALRKTGWNRRAAANELKISYKALLYKIKEYGLTPGDRRKTPAIGGT